eukprot:4671625-Lingulodinium_polyedra.AAC.1
MHPIRGTHYVAQKRDARPEPRLSGGGLCARRNAHASTTPRNGSAWQRDGVRKNHLARRQLLA